MIFYFKLQESMTKELYRACEVKFTEKALKMYVCKMTLLKVFIMYVIQ